MCGLINETVNSFVEGFSNEDQEHEIREDLVENSLMIMNVLPPNIFKLLANNEKVVAAAEGVDEAVETLKKYLHWEGEGRVMNNDGGIHSLSIF